jgi:hypothetical protein
MSEPAPERTPLPSFHHVDVDGDRLLIAAADIPGQGAGVCFRTDYRGSSVPVDEIDGLIEQLRVIRDAAKGAVDHG